MAPPSTSRDAQPAQSPQSESNVVSRLIPFLLNLQETQPQILQLLVGQANRVPLPSRDDYLALKVTLVDRKDSVAMKHSLGVQKPIAFLTRSEVEAISEKKQVLPRQFPLSSCLHIPEK